MGRSVEPNVTCPSCGETSPFFIDRTFSTFLERVRALHEVDENQRVGTLRCPGDGCGRIYAVRIKNLASGVVGSYSYGAEAEPAS